MTMPDNCDMCGTPIQNGKCSCGSWKNAEELGPDHMRDALDQFHDMKKMAMGCERPHLGVAAVFFRGDYRDCQKIQEFIYQMKGRPFYKDEEWP